MQAAGGHPSLGQAGAKSRQLSPEEIIEAAPERVVICPCGYGLDRAWQELDVLRDMLAEYGCVGSPLAERGTT